MGSSCLKNYNINNNITQTQGQIIKLNGCSDETHDYNHQIFESNSDYLITKQQISQTNENTNKQKSISPPIEIIYEQTIKEEQGYEISYIKESDIEYNILKKLYNILQEKEINNNKSNVIIKYNNGEKYIGEWDNYNHRNGRGIHIFINNNIYYGYWERNKMKGIGKLIKFSTKIDNLDIIFNEKNLPFYYGEWDNNLEDGKGEEIWKDESLYRGEYKKGFKEGKGLLILKDGTEYEGDFFHSKIEGKGIIKYKDGRIYDGNWLDNKMNGQGTFKWPDGRIYKGNYLNNYKNGYGEFIWPNGKIYKGMWVNGKQNGRGKMYNKKYDIWISGIWKDGKRIKENNDEK